MTGYEHGSKPVRLARAVALALAAIGLAWAAELVVFGGFDATVFGARLSSHEPLRPFVVGCLALMVYVALGGTLPDLRRLVPAPRIQALALSLAVTAFGVTYATTAGSGSDPYGYVSQADLWLKGNLRVEQPWVAEATWPSKAWSFAPLAYRPTDEGRALLPTYSPGLALLMAGAKAVGGQEAMFWVVPICGGLLVLATYAAGRRLAPPGAAIIATWLMASSPVMLYMLVQPMSDVPAAAAWLVACSLLLRPGVAIGAAAGLAAAVALLIRPNLILLAAVLAALPLVRARHAGNGGDRGWRQAIVFGACASLGAIAVAVINLRLYGTPFESGYGDLGGAFALSHMWPNAVKYGSWLVESQTVAALAGILAVLAPSRRLWPDAAQRRLVVVMAVFVTLVWLLYCLYLEFDAWWYLRFMLPALPFIAIGTAALAIAIMSSGGRKTRALVTIALALLVGMQCQFAVDSGTLRFWSGERRYLAVDRLVAAAAAPRSVVFSIQHSGSLRYYGGLTTLRFDNLDAGSLDEAVAWLTSRGVHAYLLAEEWEVPMFRERFEGQAVLSRLATPLIVYTGTLNTRLYDLAADHAGPPLEVPVTVDGLRSVPPAPGLPLVLNGG